MALFAPSTLCLHETDLPIASEMSAGNIRLLTELFFTAVGMVVCTVSGGYEACPQFTSPVTLTHTLFKKPRNTPTSLDLLLCTPHFFELHVPQLYIYMMHRQVSRLSR